MKRAMLLIVLIFSIVTIYYGKWWLFFAGLAVYPIVGIGAFLFSAYRLRGLLGNDELEHKRIERQLVDVTKDKNRRHHGISKRSE